MGNIKDIFGMMGMSGNLEHGNVLKQLVMIPQL